MNILDDLLRREGVSEEDIAYYHLSLEEKRALLPNPLLPADKAFMIDVGGISKTLTIENAAKLCDEGISLGIISTPLPFPPLAYDLDEQVGWQEVHQRFISPFMYELNGAYLVYLSDKTVYARSTKTGKTHTVSNLLNLKETPDLFDHVMSGGKAVMMVLALTATWMTEHDYNQLIEHKKNQEARDDCLIDWGWLYEQVTNAKDPEMIAKRAAHKEKIKALAINQEKQRQALKKLPFKWEGRIKEVLSGLTENSDGTGHKKNTVIHIRLLEDFQRGRLVRKSGEYLCTQKKVSNWGDGGIYEKEEVTCKTCLKRAASLTKGE